MVNLENIEASNTDLNPEQQVSWYVLRYRILTKTIRNILDASSLEIFLPIRKTVNPLDEFCIEQKLVPAQDKKSLNGRVFVSSYIFVRSTLQDALALSKSVNLPLWSRKDNEGKYRYISIDNDQMVLFKKAMEINNGEPVPLFSANYVDIERDDKVVFVSGQFKGVQGYLKSGRGLRGGLVVVPLTSQYSYGLTAKKEELGVLEFAKSTKHATRCIVSMSKELDDVIASYEREGELSLEQSSRMKAYSLRYGSTTFSTEYQEAVHLLNLYCISLLLSDEKSAADMKVRLESVIIPKYKARAQEAERRTPGKALVAYKEFIDKKNRVEGQMAPYQITINA